MAFPPPPCSALPSLPPSFLLAPTYAIILSKTLGFSLGLDYREASMVISGKNATKYVETCGGRDGRGNGAGAGGVSLETSSIVLCCVVLRCTYRF